MYIFPECWLNRHFSANQNHHFSWSNDPPMTRDDNRQPTVPSSVQRNDPPATGRTWGNNGEHLQNSKILGD